MAKCLYMRSNYRKHVQYFDMTKEGQVKNRDRKLIPKPLPKYN